MVSPCVRSPGRGTAAFRTLSDTTAMGASSHGLAARCAPTGLCAPWELSPFSALAAVALPWRGSGAAATLWWHSSEGRWLSGCLRPRPGPSQSTGRTSASQASTAR